MKLFGKRRLSPAARKLKCVRLVDGLLDLVAERAGTYAEQYFEEDKSLRYQHGISPYADINQMSRDNAGKAATQEVPAVKAPTRETDAIRMPSRAFWTQEP